MIRSLLDWVFGWRGVLVLVCGIGLVVVTKIERELRELRRADLVPRWKAFIEAGLIVDGKPLIKRAVLPPVKPLMARRYSSWLYRLKVRA